eukprot:g775.t1
MDPQRSASGVKLKAPGRRARTSLTNEDAAALSDAGARENGTKREQGDTTPLDVRNLGAYTEPPTDIRTKIGKAWKAYHRRRRMMSGMAKLSNARRGELVVVMVRPILTHGLARTCCNDTCPPALSADVGAAASTVKEEIAMPITPQRGAHTCCGRASASRVRK